MAEALNRSDVLEKVREHLSTELEVPLDQISESTRMREDLDADSLDLYELVMELEDTYGISVSEEEAADIETVAQADILRTMGCDTVQGFIFSPAMFEEEFMAWTNNARAGAKSVA